MRPASIDISNRQDRPPMPPENHFGETLDSGTSVNPEEISDETNTSSSESSKEESAEQSPETPHDPDDSPDFMDCQCTHKLTRNCDAKVNPGQKTIHVVRKSKKKTTK